MNSQPELTSLLLEIKEEVSLIRRYLEFQITDFVKEELDKIASTHERKLVWMSLDGTKTTQGIAEEVGISIRAVQHFIKQLRELNLIAEKKKGYPQRRIDIIPSKWEKIRETNKSEEEEIDNGKRRITCLEGNLSEARPPNSPF
jgi:transcription initiation factor IIE alpha subunit